MEQEGRTGAREVGHEASAERLKANLDVLAGRQPALAMELHRTPVLTICEAKNGEPSCVIEVDGHERWVHSAHDPTAEAQRCAQQLPSEARSVLCVGAGLGYLPAMLLRRPDLTVVLLEPHFQFLRAMLALFDFRDALRERRLLLMTATDVDIAVLSGFEWPSHEIHHPALGVLYADRRRHIRYLTRVGTSRGRAIVVYSKLFAEDVADLFEQKGFAVRMVLSSDLTLGSFQALVGEVDPSFMFTVNHSPEVALLCSRAGLAYVSWTIDPLPAKRIAVLPGTDLSLCVAFAHRRVLVEQLAAVGLRGVRYLPLAASSAKRHSVDDEQLLAPYRCPVSFVGSSLAVDHNALLRWMRQLGGDDALEQRAIRFVEELYQREARDADYLGLPEDGSAAPDWLLEGLSGDVDPVEASDRINGALSHLLRIDRVQACRAKGIAVYGDEGWETCGDAYRGRAEHGEELTRIYNASCVNLDIPRIYQRDIITLRVFDTLLCGGLLLTEPSSALLDLFTADTHVVTYRDEPGMLRCIDELNRDPERVRAIREAGRQCVQQSHTMDLRVAVMLEVLAERGLGGDAVAQALE
jgi:hypothetical protein